MIDSFSDLFGNFRRRLELYSPYFNTSLMYDNQLTKTGAVKKGSGPNLPYKQTHSYFFFTLTVITNKMCKLELF